jgi:hypothetical protein
MKGKPRSDNAVMHICFWQGPIFSYHNNLPSVVMASLMSPTSVLCLMASVKMSQSVVYPAIYKQVWQSNDTMILCLKSQCKLTN